MGQINNERYSTILENICVFNNKFTCAYYPVYGLVKMNDMVLKIPSYTGTIYTNYTNEDIITINYIQEKIYPDGYHGKKLTEEEIYKILISE